MAFLFGKGKKTPQELVKSFMTYSESLTQAQPEPSDEKSVKKAEEKISTSLSGMKFTLYGEADGTEPKKENIDKLCELFFSAESPVLLLMLQHMKLFEFEARKDVAQIYNYVLRQRKQQAIDYVIAHQEILTMLIKGYEDPEIALNCGSILRECIRHQQLCECVLRSPPLFNPFFEYVQLSTFDVASDAFATFKMLLTKHKPLCAKFLETSFDDIFTRYNVLLESKNYVTKRQSLKLLGELLLDRTNFKTMMKYINSPNNLKIMMNLLRGTTKAIQFEAFHVFKIFVANPQKTKPITEILLRNREKLVEFLKKFQTDKEDEQFNEEKRILLGALQKLDPAVLGPERAAALAAEQAAEAKNAAQNSGPSPGPTAASAVPGPNAAAPTAPSATNPPSVPHADNPPS